MSELPKEIEVELLGRKVVLKEYARDPHNYYSDDLPRLTAGELSGGGERAWKLNLFSDNNLGDGRYLDLFVMASASTPQETAAKIEATVREHFTDPAMVFGFKEGSDA